MKIFVVSILFALSLVIPNTAKAALIKFDVGPLIGVFSQAPLTGSFILDTDSQSLSDIALSSSAGSFNSGVAIDNAAGFGLRATSFLLSGDAELLFEVESFDRVMPGLAPGESATVFAFISQAADFNDNFQNPAPFLPPSDIFNGNITVSRLAEVSMPAGISLVAALFCALLLTRSRV